MRKSEGEVNGISNANHGSLRFYHIYPQADFVISTETKVLNLSSSDGDFTVERYQQLLKLARRNYEVALYTDIPWSKHFILIKDMS